VRDPSGERLGEVEDVFLSLETGAAERILVEVDAGFLGLFDRTTSVAPGAIAIDPLDGSVVVDRSALKSEGGDEGE
jgi:sporulation protein YlmC with PRC-barrel domain